MGVTRGCCQVNPSLLLCHAPPTPGWADVAISGDLQELFDKFPTPGDNFMLQIPYYSPGMRWGNAGKKLCSN